MNSFLKSHTLPLRRSVPDTKSRPWLMTSTDLKGTTSSHKSLTCTDTPTHTHSTSHMHASLIKTQHFHWLYSASRWVSREEGEQKKLIKRLHLSSTHPWLFSVCMCVCVCMYFDTFVASLKSSTEVRSDKVNLYSTGKPEVWKTPRNTPLSRRKIMFFRLF